MGIILALALAVTAPESVAEPWLTEPLTITLIGVLGSILVALISTRRKVGAAQKAVEESQKVVVEVHHLVNSQRTRLLEYQQQLWDLIRQLGGEVPDQELPDSDPPPMSGPPGQAPPADRDDAQG